MIAKVLSTDSLVISVQSSTNHMGRSRQKALLALRRSIGNVPMYNDSHVLWVSMPLPDGQATNI